MILLKLLTKLLRDKNLVKSCQLFLMKLLKHLEWMLYLGNLPYSSEVQSMSLRITDKVMFYRESESGIMLEEGINEAGAFSAWLALATSYSKQSIPYDSIYIFYSMFDFKEFMIYLGCRRFKS